MEVEVGIGMTGESLYGLANHIAHTDWQSIQPIQIGNLCELYGMTRIVNPYRLYRSIFCRYEKNLPSNWHCHCNTHHEDDKGNEGNKPPRQCR